MNDLYVITAYFDIGHRIGAAIDACSGRVISAGDGASPGVDGTCGAQIDCLCFFACVGNSDVVAGDRDGCYVASG